MELPLLRCGCQKLQFTCVFCKKAYTRSPTPKRTLRVHQDILQTPLGYDELPSTMMSRYLPLRYYKFKSCKKTCRKSELSIWCPKAVSLNPCRNYICAACRLDSIKILYNKKTHPALQLLLELNFF